MIPDVLGTQEVAALLGVSRQRVAILANAETFPRGLDLARGTVWDGPTMRAYAQDRTDPRNSDNLARRNQRALLAYRETKSINAAATAGRMTWETARDRLRLYGELQDENAAV